MIQRSFFTKSQQVFRQWVRIGLSCFMLGGMVSGCTQQKNIVTEQDTVFLPPEELIVANIQETDLSLAFELESVKTQGVPLTGIYGEWELTGTIFHVFDDAISVGEKFTCYQMFEKGIPEPEKGTRFIGSFKRTEEGAYVVMDNGYLFPYHPDMLEMFEKGMKQKKSPQMETDHLPPGRH